MMAEQPHPVQPLITDEHGRDRFKANAIVRFLLDDGPNDMNRLARMPFSREDWVQFAQLIGYSLTGFAELSYVTDGDYERARTEAIERGMKCPVCGHMVDDDDNWAGDKCLRCALAEEQRQGKGQGD